MSLRIVKHIPSSSGNAINLPVHDHSFDGVWSVQATQHIPSLELVYREAYRVLKIGGLFADYNLNHSNLTKFIYRFLGKKYMGIIRTTFLISPKGKILKIWPNVRVKDHAQEVLGELKKLV